MKIKFLGDEANQHRIPAYYGAISLRGFARIFVMTGHYVSTGKIRRRYPYDNKIEFYYKAQKEGSLEQLIEIVVNNPIGQGAIGGALGNIATTGLNQTAKLSKGFIDLVIKKASGLLIDSDDDFLVELDNHAPNEIDALVEALQPAIRDVHVPITQGISDIRLIDGTKNLVTLNEQTREYVFTSILEDQENVAEASVASLNVNTGSGRAFVFEYGMSFPFSVDKNASPNTIAILSTSLNRYALDDNSHILIKFSKVKTSDNRIKKIIINEAKFIKS